MNKYKKKSNHCNNPTLNYCIEGNKSNKLNHCNIKQQEPSRTKECNAIIKRQKKNVVLLVLN